MDYVEIFAVILSYGVVGFFGYIAGAVVFAKNLRDRLNELMIDRETIELIMERKPKKP